ncbi:MAG: NAD-dependent epimerase/dehydratase family protein [Chloroflexi bacterium]|nr:NAD-dependent epimerase/dehydratase family protein [Chloroflexota bacterium]
MKARNEEAKRVLVTGGAGFIGSHIVDKLVELGHSVAVVDDLSAGRKGYVNKQAHFYQMDICSPQLSEVFKTERPQIVNHHAAQIQVQRSVREPILDAQTNILGSLNVLENARKYGVEKVVFPSSGGTIYGEPEYLPCDEGHPIRPLSPYAAAKYAVETYIQLYRVTYGLSYTILRYSSVYGPRQDPYGEAGVIAIFAQAMLDGRVPTINGSGEQERDFLYIDDVVEANLMVMSGGEGQILNIGTGRGTSVNSIFQQLKDIIRYSKEAVHGPPKPGEVFRICLGISKAQCDLGWLPRVSLQEGLQRTVDHFRSLSSTAGNQ